MPDSSFSSRVALLRVVGAAGLLTVAGCTEPVIDRPGTWRATGINDRNLSAMLVNPADMSGGTGAQTARGDTGARAVTRLLTDKRRQLLNVTTAKVGGSNETPSDPALPTGGGSSGGGGVGAGAGAAQ